MAFLIRDEYPGDDQSVSYEDYFNQIALDAGYLTPCHVPQSELPLESGMTTLSGMRGVCPLSNYLLPAHPGWTFVRLLKWHIHVRIRGVVCPIEDHYTGVPVYQGC